MTKTETSYHRDDLRGDLLRVGREFVAANGHHSLSVRTLAQSVNVSPGAPYHHFRDRRSLLLALALDGFDDLFGRAQMIVSSTQPPEQTLIALGLSFLEFATSSPRLLELMYESELTSPTIDPALHDYHKAGEKAMLEPLRAAALDCDEVELRIRGLSLWSTIYGFAQLRRKQMTQTSIPLQISESEIAKRVVTLAVRSAMLVSRETRKI